MPDLGGVSGCKRRKRHGGDGGGASFLVRGSRLYSGSFEMSGSNLRCNRSASVKMSTTAATALSILCDRLSRGGATALLSAAGFAAIAATGFLPVFVPTGFGFAEIAGLRDFFATTVFFAIFLAMFFLAMFFLAAFFFAKALVVVAAFAVRFRFFLAIVFP
ncbi:MAG: hypothetical protein WBF02_18440 [Xanthobacteraceae bacterium]